MSIDAATRIGAVHLTIADLERSIDFYQSRLGFRVLSRSGAGPQTSGGEEPSAVLGAGGAALLALSERPTAPRVHGTAGLYHFAILVPSRRDLAASLRRLIETGTAMQGAADHGVSESVYLADPDGNGIEIYRDRPREEWPIVAGSVRMGTDPLDLDDLLEESGASEAGTGLPAGTTVGHMHLHVSDLKAAEHFYVRMLGFDLIQRYGPAALFVSAGGYHHHVGLNTWAGVGAPPSPPGAIGLRHFEVVLRDESVLNALVARLQGLDVEVQQNGRGVLVRDPSRNALLLTVS